MKRKWLWLATAAMPLLAAGCSSSSDAGIALDIAALGVSFVLELLGVLGVF